MSAQSTVIIQRVIGSNGFVVLQPSPMPQEIKAPPPTKPKPSSTSSSIKEKQLPLLSIFSQQITPPPASAPPPLPPPLPSPLSDLGNRDWEEYTGKGEYWLHPGHLVAERGWGQNQSSGPREVTAHVLSSARWPETEWAV